VDWSILTDKPTRSLISFRQTAVVDNLSAIPAISTVDDARRTSRTHLFVGATLYHGGLSAPVRVRNMSPSGALIEVDTLPEIGTEVTLRRGSLEAAGRIAWKAESKAGLAFSAPVHVLDWMSRRLASHQSAVDAIVADYKNDRQARTPCKLDMISMEADLAKTRSELSHLEACLAEDLVLVATHPEIQALDIAIQRIDRILRDLGGPPQIG
jgi:hypothetical protein